MLCDSSAAQRPTDSFRALSISALAVRTSARQTSTHPCDVAYSRSPTASRAAAGFDPRSGSAFAGRQTWRATACVVTLGVHRLTVIFLEAGQGALGLLDRVA